MSNDCSALANLCGSSGPQLISSSISRTNQRGEIFSAFVGDLLPHLVEGNKILPFSEETKTSINNFLQLHPTAINYFNSKQADSIAMMTGYDITDQNYLNIKRYVMQLM